MKTFGTRMAALAAFSVAYALPKDTPPGGGSVLAYPSQGCNNCLASASANRGFPDCIIYDSDDNLGQEFATSDGAGYNVWWDSGPPNPDCQIIVRTPASTDTPACGYFLTGWKKAGCYKTLITDSFMLQYCCGSGDCDAARPAASIEDAHYQMLHGNTSSVSLMIENLSGPSGKSSIEGIGEIAWERVDHRSSENEFERRTQDAPGKCTFSPSTGKVREGGRQTRITSNTVCNSGGSCSDTVSY